MNRKTLSYIRYPLVFILSILIVLLFAFELFADNILRTYRENSQKTAFTEKYNDNITISTSTKTTSENSDLKPDTISTNSTAGSEGTSSNTSKSNDFDEVMKKIKEINSDKNKKNSNNEIILGTKGNSLNLEKNLNLLIIWK